MALASLKALESEAWRPRDLQTCNTFKIPLIWLIPWLYHLLCQLGLHITLYLLL